MAPGEPTLIRFYRGWERYQELLTRTVVPLSPEQLALRAAPSLRPAWLLTAHIVAARVNWFHRVLGEGPPAVAPLQAWDDDGQPPRGGVELAEGLAATWAVIAEVLGRWTPALLDEPVTTPRGRTFTRQWVIWHVIEHDLHHGGELFLTLGMHGLPTPEL